MLQQVPRGLLTFVMGCLFFGSAAAQTQVTIDANMDNTLYEDASGATSNGVGQNFFVGRTNLTTGSIRRGLLSFDVAASLPANATITNVALTLSMSKSNAGDQDVTLHRATAPWGEGTSVAAGEGGAGAPATANDATWLHRFFSTTLWSNAGGDFSATPSASQAVGGIAFYTWGSTTAMVSDVQQWLNTPSTNFGWVLLGNESVGATSKRFDTRENDTIANRPKLTVTYTTPASVDENVPHTFVLHQNYPNPFNPVTNFQFSIANSQLTILRVYDMLGREVATLVNGVLEAGNHVMKWDGTHTSSGVYVYRLQAGAFTATRKLVLSK